MLNEMRLSRRRILTIGSAAVASLAAGGLLAACGEADEDLGGNGGRGGSGDSTATPEPEPTATDPPAEPIFADGEAAVFQVEYEGGFIAMEDLVRRPPIVSLFNDGSLIYPGPIPEIFPQPAAPHLLVTTLSDKGIEAVGRKVLETGLFEDGDLNLDGSDMLITDAPHTVFTVRLAGQEEPVRVSVYALDFDEHDDMLPEDKAEARRKLRELLRYVTSAPTGFPTDHIVAQETQYEPERLELVIYPWDEVGYDFEVEPTPVAWPLDEAPLEMGEAYTFPGHNAVCAVLGGEDLDAMLDALAGANVLTPWEHDGEWVYMINRVLLPGEEKCVSPFDSDGAPEPEPSIEHPNGADELVLRYELSGGYVPLESLVTTMPVVSVYGDGRVFTQGAQILIYPPPALPAIDLGRLTPEGIQIILHEAQALGMLAGQQTWNEAANFIADAHTGELTIHAAGDTHVIRVYAPGMLDIGDMVSEEELDFRRRFDEFIGKLTAMSEWLPEDVYTAVDAEVPYDRLQVVSLPAELRPVEQGIQPDEQDWPLETPLGERGDPHSLIEMGRCFVLEGQEFIDVIDLLRDATTLTRWNSAGHQYLLHFRPLLPDEEGCQDPLA